MLSKNPKRPEVEASLNAIAEENLHKDPSEDFVASRIDQDIVALREREMCSKEVYDLLQESRLEVSTALADIDNKGRIRQLTDVLLKAVRGDLEDLDLKLLKPEERLLILKEEKAIADLYREEAVA